MVLRKTISELTADTPAGNPSLSTEFVSGPGYTYSLSEIKATPNDCDLGKLVRQIAG
jgi:hypothetical protein